MTLIKSISGIPGYDRRSARRESDAARPGQVHVGLRPVVAGEQRGGPAPAGRRRTRRSPVGRDGRLDRDGYAVRLRDRRDRYRAGHDADGRDGRDGQRSRRRDHSDGQPQSRAVECVEAARIARRVPQRRRGQTGVGYCGGRRLRLPRGGRAGACRLSRQLRPRTISTACWPCRWSTVRRFAGPGSASSSMRSTRWEES